MIVVFLGVIIGGLVFLGAVQAKSIKKINWYLLGYKKRSFEYAALINSGLLLFFRLILTRRYIFGCANFMA